jgi:hypothetical protein
VGCDTRFLLLLAVLPNYLQLGAAAVTFFKIFISFALFVCFVVAVLHFFGKLVIELFGIVDGRPAGSPDRYA